MSSTKGRKHLPVLPLAPGVTRQERRHEFGRTEAAVVRVLLAQRKRHCQGGSHASLCLTQNELMERLGLPCETPVERQRAWETIRLTIWRVNAKLAAHDLVIASLQCLGLASPRYAIFSLQEVWAVS